MSVVKFWSELSSSAKFGLASGALLVCASVGAVAYWTLSSDYEVVMRSSSPDKVAAAVREVERLKIPYRVTDDGTSVEVPQSQLGRIKVGLADSGGVTSGVGFELFNNTDFSTTEFTQKINYQRALQGELARTISAIDGVASARVHLVMAESGFLRRQSVKPAAAVNVMMEDGAQLSPPQVQGIQRLVAASVPDIKLDDIAVIDQDGIALTRNKTGTDMATPSQGRLELKREVDAYLEGKLKRLLANVDPAGEFSVSVDATLNLDDVKVTTEDVIPAEGQTGKSTGVLVHERQTQRSDGVVADRVSGVASGPQSASTTRELEYKVGRRVEQIATTPGGIERMSVAVLARATASDADVLNIKKLVIHAIGASEERGDSVAVVVLPTSSSQSHLSVTPDTAASVPAHRVMAQSHGWPDKADHGAVKALAWLLGLVMLLVLGWVAWARNQKAGSSATTAQDLTPNEVDVIVSKVNGWLDAGERSHGTA